VVYKLMATLFGSNTIEVPDQGFVHDLPAMAAAIDSRTKEVFIANPNNPTGTLVNQEALDRFMDQVPEHVVVVFDEAYYEFLQDPPDTLKISGRAGTSSSCGRFRRSRAWPELGSVTGSRPRNSPASSRNAANRST